MARVSKVDVDWAPDLDHILTGNFHVGQVLESTANWIAQTAQDLAFAEASEYGDYARGIRATLGYDNVRGKLISGVVATDFKSHWVEFGSYNVWSDKRIEGKHILSRAAAMSGYIVHGHDKL